MFKGLKKRRAVLKGLKKKIAMFKRFKKRRVFKGLKDVTALV